MAFNFNTSVRATSNGLTKVAVGTAATASAVAVGLIMHYWPDIVDTNTEVALTQDDNEDEDDLEEISVEQKLSRKGLERGGWQALGDHSYANTWQDLLYTDAHGAEGPDGRGWNSTHWDDDTEDGYGVFQDDQEFFVGFNAFKSNVETRFGAASSFAELDQRFGDVMDRLDDDGKWWWNIEKRQTAVLALWADRHAELEFQLAEFEKAVAAVGEFTYLLDDDYSVTSEADREDMVKAFLALKNDWGSVESDESGRGRKLSYSEAFRQWMEYEFAGVEHGDFTWNNLISLRDELMTYLSPDLTEEHSSYIVARMNAQGSTGSEFDGQWNYEFVTDDLVLYNDDNEVARTEMAHTTHIAAWDGSVVAGANFEELLILHEVFNESFLNASEEWVQEQASASSYIGSADACKLFVDQGVGFVIAGHVEGVEWGHQEWLLLQEFAAHHGVSDRVQNERVWTGSEDITYSWTWSMESA